MPFNSDEPSLIDRAHPRDPETAVFRDHEDVAEAQGRLLGMPIGTLLGAAAGAGTGLLAASEMFPDHVQSVLRAPAKFMGAMGGDAVKAVLKDPAKALTMEGIKGLLRERTIPNLAGTTIGMLRGLKPVGTSVGLGALLGGGLGLAGGYVLGGRSGRESHRDELRQVQREAEAPEFIPEPVANRGTLLRAGGGALLGGLGGHMIGGTGGAVGGGLAGLLAGALWGDTNRRYHEAMVRRARHMRQADEVALALRQDG